MGMSNSFAEMTLWIHNFDDMPNAAVTNSVPSNPNEARSTGWTEQDVGDQGDGFYRAFCAAAQAMEQPDKKLSKEACQKASSLATLWIPAHSQCLGSMVAQVVAAAWACGLHSGHG